MWWLVNALPVAHDIANDTAHDTGSKSIRVCLVGTDDISLV